LSRINATPGVLRLITFGDVPQPIPAEVIEAIRERVDDLNTRYGQPEYLFHPGDAARFKGGPLRGLEAVFVRLMKSSLRARVLMTFLGQLSEVEVEMQDLEPASSKLAPHPERRTRGKGRKIGERNANVTRRAY
jgi:transcriptional antiterminator RfaH